MKIQNTPNLKLNSTTNDQLQNGSLNSAAPAFKGGGDSFAMFLRFLDTNQAWGASAVDVTCMCTPRTLVDFTRGPDAGLETARREFSSTIDDALVGAYGVGAAWLLSQTFNNKFGVKAHKMFIGDEMVDILSHTWNEKSKAKDPLKDFLNQVVGTTKGFNPDHASADKKGWIGIDKASQAKVVDKLVEEIKNGPESMSKETKAYLKSILATSTGSERNFRIEKQIGNTKKEAITSLDDFISDVYKLSKAFTNEKVTETFKNGDISSNAFIKGLKGTNRKASIVGVGIATGIGLCLQPLNMYLTRKKTGKTGFVGVEGREPDDSKGFKILKYAIAGAAGLAVLKSIGKFSEILSKIQFKGFTPTIAQYKFVYGFTVVSRLLSARDKNELRESSIKDSLGYASWLIIGGFVSKFTAMGIQKMAKFKNTGEKFIRYNAAQNGEGGFNKLIKSSLVTRDEALYESLKKAGISTIKDGKALNFKEMMKLAPQSAKTKIRYIGLIQMAGYLYSGLALGVGIPKLNIAITNSVEKKRKAEEAKHKHHNENKPVKMPVDESVKEELKPNSVLETADSK